MFLEVGWMYENMYQEFNRVEYDLNWWRGEDLDGIEYEEDWWVTDDIFLTTYQRVIEPKRKKIDGMLVTWVKGG